MSDDCGGDTVPGCADTGRDSYESGGGNDDISSYMDLTECTEITFTENIGYERDYYDGVVNQHHVNIHQQVNTHHVSDTITTSNGSGGIIIVILTIFFLYIFGNEIFFALKFDNQRLPITYSIHFLIIHIPQRFSIFSR